jgi:hypothetical protein
MAFLKGERCMVNGEQSEVKVMSQAALGRALGLSPAAITKLKGQGMPVNSVESAQAWREARQNLAARKPVPDLAKLAAPYTPAPAPRRPDVGAPPMDWPDLPDEDRDTARTRREIAEANMAEMDEARLRREQIRLAAVQAALSTDYATTRDAMLQIPARMAPLLAAESDPAAVQNLLHGEIHQALMQLAGAAEHLPNIEGAFE